MPKAKGTPRGPVMRVRSPRGIMLTTLAVWAILRGKRRSFADDARRAIVVLHPPSEVENAHLVPRREAFLLVANHFQDGDFWVGWEVIAITEAVTKMRAPAVRELHWLVTSSWPWLRVAGRTLPNPLSTVFFPRASYVWGLIPTPWQNARVAERASALRGVLGRLGVGRGGLPGEPVGLFPEGTATVALQRALPGVGAFAHFLGKRGVPVLPVGAFPRDGRLVIRFGAPFLLSGRPPDPPEELDRWAADRLMVAIARLLPRDLWGAYAAAASRAEDGSPRW